MANWDDLPTDLANIISLCIPRNADYIRFRAVCSSWRNATDNVPPHLPRQVPFLLLPGETFTIYSPMENRSYRVPFPSGNQHHFLGSSHGWLFMMGPTTSLFLLNPFSRCMITLPSVVEIPNLFDQVGPAEVEKFRGLMDRQDRNSTSGFWKYLLHKGKLCLDQNSTGFWIAVAFLTSGLAFYRPGDKSWTHAGRYWQFADAEFYNGQLYAITRGGILSTIDVMGSFKEAVVVPSSPISLTQDVSMHLVTSAQDLLLVVRKHGFNSAGCRKTTGFEVFKMETQAPSWTRVKKLGNNTIFLERGTSVSLPTSGLVGFEGNYIYFTEGYDPCEEDKYKGTDFGCYCLERGNMTELLCCSRNGELAWPGPTWVTPCLW